MLVNKACINEVPKVVRLKLDKLYWWLQPCNLTCKCFTAHLKAFLLLACNSPYLFANPTKEMQSPLQFV